MNDNFYAFFESINYASEEQVEENRTIYLPYVEPILKYFNSPLAFDVGCGRGEWLHMLRKLGFKTQGVDINSGMLKSALNKGLDVYLDDGINYLHKLESNSVSVLTAFHVLEHLHFKDIQEFFFQSQRILMPGGILIVETPNPENLHVATTNFYLDPTHIRPIPILQMITLCKANNFNIYSIIRLQEDKTLYYREDIYLKDLFYGVSKDYALIAQKEGGNTDLLNALKLPMKYETGIGIDEILKRLDAKIDKLLKIENSIMDKDK
ncbi:class I SAM-dependent methyltransferase [Ferrovum sp. PN-J185]|uniref:class I SAM-dependent methyltransferase n=1 Tax=Ferrovum sp. PN-J185 TaxID=1356306 RepID=UPI001E60A2E3|nr:class I SAM-dependent methyltransferase [Ferrovum sp. PN-J185]MCC6068767.1 class I SAM-dependent methyltransferase [Ferrovum sp. PN-J185]